MRRGWIFTKRKRKGHEVMGKSTVHMCIDLRGVLRSMLDADDDEEDDGLPMWKILSNDDGMPMTWDEAFSALCDEIAKGRRVYPMVDCDNFDYQTGCKGHDVKGSG